MGERAEPPVAPKRAVHHELHGVRWTDDWHWLRQKDDPEVIALLEAENAHTDACMVHTKELQERLFQEMRSRIQETDASVPVHRDEWLYVSRTEEGKQYSRFCRAPFAGNEARFQGTSEGTTDWAQPLAGETVILDQNLLAEGKEYHSLGLLAISIDHRRLAFSEDFAGDETYTLRFLDLGTGEFLADRIENVGSGGCWSADGRHFFYLVLDAAHRPYQLWRHRMGTAQSEDVKVHQEDDERFLLGISLSRSRRFLMLECSSHVTSEVRLLRADDAEGVFRLVAPREHQVEYSLEDLEDRWYVLTNADGARNFKLMTAPLERPEREHWQEFLAHREDVFLEGITAFRRHLVREERARGDSRLVVHDFVSQAEFTIDGEEPCSDLWVDQNPTYDTTELRYGYQSLKTPRSTYEIDLVTRERRLLKRVPVLGEFRREDYVTERRWAKAADGAEIPISLIRRADLEEGPWPCLLYGYGSYGINVDPYFSHFRLSILDRGMVFAIAHVRGSSFLGRQWYESAKLEHKQRTFDDFVACAEHLIAEGVTAPERLGIEGGSAGGMLMGAVLNARPELFRCVLALVPFVDCVNTMLDTSLPLTVPEFDEWGDPRDERMFHAIRAYAPYENVRAVELPAVFVRSGLNDPRVQYWEPTKWVQKLRDVASGGPVLLRTHMGAGHGGASGRYDAWREAAEEFAFLLDRLGLGEREPVYVT